MSLDLTIFARPGGQPDADWVGYTGWTRTRVTTGIETVPGEFDIEATDRYPGEVSKIDIMPGYECYIELGTQRTLTGYVDQVLIDISGDEHTIRIVGRSKACDLVDCSAEFSTFQLIDTDPVSLATKLCSPFGINVVTLGDIGSTQIPQFDVILTETPYEIIERVARFAALLAYDDEGGDMVLSRTGSTSMASGFTQGQNVERASVAFTMNERFSKVSATLQSTDTLFTEAGDPDAPNAAQALAQSMVQGALAFDLGVPRYRPLIIVAEQGDMEYQVAQQRCQWEVNRRVGRSQQIVVVCDSWTDSEGTIWKKNSLAPVDFPTLKITNTQWVIGSISFVRDEDGTHAEVTLMPGQAFQPQPIILQPYASDVYQAVAQNGGAAETNNPTEDFQVPSVIGGAQ